MIAGPLTFLAGTLGLLWLPAFPGGGPIAAVALTGLASWTASRCGSRWRWLACACLGFLAAALAADAALAVRWRAADADQRVLAEAIVESIPAAGGFGWTFDAELRLLTFRPGHILRARVTSRDLALRPAAGERWQLLIALQPPRARLNPGSADTERQLFRERIHALGTIVASRLNRRIDGGHRPLTALRERVARRIESGISDRDAAALVAALAVGATGEMSREQWRVFNATGTTHLVAISGLHVTLFALVAFAASRRLWTALISRVLPWPREPFAAAAGLGAATAYALLAGFSVPTQRTLIMLAAWLLTRTAARACRPSAPLGIALVGVLLIDPFAPLAAGFWLSFAAMAAIVIGTRAPVVPCSGWREALRLQLAISAVLAPLTLAWFGSLSLAGLLVNLVAIPLVSFVFVPLVLLAVASMPVPAVADELLALAGQLHVLGWPWLQAAADAPLALLHAAPPPWWYACAAGSLLVAAFPWPSGIRLAALVWLVPLATSGATAPPRGGLELTVLDVGQGVAVVARSANRAVLYDAGDVYGGEGQVVERTIVPFLRSRGVAAVDVLVLSRMPPGGSPGMTALLATLPVHRIVMDGPAVRRPAGTQGCGRSEWQWDAVSFATIRSGATCVLRIEAGGTAVLLTGALDVEEERRLAQHGRVRAEVVLVPRGRARTSSTELVDAVRPRWAVVSGRRFAATGEKPAVLRWSRGGAQVLTTAESGAVRFVIDPDRGLLAPAGSRAARFLWRTSP